MKLTRKRSVLLLALSLGTALAIGVGVQGASGASAAMHVKVTGKNTPAQVLPAVGLGPGRRRPPIRAPAGGTEAR